MQTWGASTGQFSLDARKWDRPVVCNIPLWGGACKYVYS